MTEIEIPDFAAMDSEALHGWEFEVYAKIEGDQDLPDIIGLEAASRYYNERGKRLDVAELGRLASEIARLELDRNEILGRLRAGISGKYHFGRMMA